MAEVSGLPFSRLTAELVFEPAGMTRSARIHRKLTLPPALAAELATPYHVDAEGSVVASDPPPPQGDGAAGGVISTAMDLARYSALYLKAPGRDLTLILLANSDGLKWNNGLDEAAVEGSPFAAAFLEAFPPRKRKREARVEPVVSPPMPIPRQPGLFDRVG